MTREEIIRMAREAATEDGSVKRSDGKNIVIYAAKTSLFLERFAALVAKHEREECAKVCESLKPTMRAYDHRFWDACHESAAAIRARGQE